MEHVGDEPLGQIVASGHREEPQVTDNSGGTVVRWSDDSAQIVVG